MVEPITLGVIAAALAAKAVERAEDGAVDAGAKAVRRVLESLKAYFGDDREEGAQALERVSEAPDSPSRVRELAVEIDAAAERSPELRGELEALIQEAREAGVAISSISQQASGQGNIQIAGVVDSTVEIGERSTPPPGK